MASLWKQVTTNEGIRRPARAGKGAQIHRLGRRGWHRLRELSRGRLLDGVAVPHDLHGAGGGVMQHLGDITKLDGAAVLALDVRPYGGLSAGGRDARQPV